VTFIGDVNFNGLGTDQSGLPSTLLEDGVSPQNGLNGFGSAIAYTGYSDRYVLLADRGPNKFSYPGGAAVDNTTSYDNRYQIFDISVVPDASSSTGYDVAASNVGTTLLKNSQGVQFQGISTGFSTSPSVENHRLDSEGIRVAPDGTIYVSDEYGPYIYHFNQQGQEIGQLTVPASFEIANPGPNAAAEAANNSLGRVTNKGLEGIAISPDGKTLVAALQSPLIQDGGNASTNDRLLVYDLTNPGVPPKEYLYQLDSGLAISEILAVNNHEFIIDERDGTAGGGKKLLYEVDLNQSSAPTDLTNSAYAGTTTANGLPKSGTPAGIVPLAKTLFANIGQILIAANPFVPGSGGLPDKIEGYAWGPILPDGNELLLATNDNDFSTSVTGGFPDYIFAFEVSGLNDFQAEQFPAGYTFPAPEPATLVIFLAGFLGLTVVRRRRTRAVQ